jgi:putative transposase
MNVKPQRRSIRIPDFDYSQSVYYYATICTKDKEYYFGDIVKEKMTYSQVGKYAKQCWEGIPKHYPDTVLDTYQIMPNHIHGIIFIKPVGVQNIEPERHNHMQRVENFQPLQNKFQKIIPRSLGCIVRGFKIGVTKLCKQNGLEFAWQRNFYEHIVEEDGDLDDIRRYIKDNPKNWEEDIENRKRINRKFKSRDKYYQNKFK